MIINVATIYDNTKNTILEGFNTSPDRMDALVELYIHGGRGDCLERICNDPALDEKEKCLLLIDLGAKIALQGVEDKLNEAAQIAHASKKSHLPQ